MSRVQSGGYRAGSFDMVSRAGSSMSTPVRRASAAVPLRPSNRFNANERNPSTSQASHERDHDDEENKPKKSLKPVVRFLVTNIGLVVAVVLYIVGGAFLFQLLEQHNEIQNCQEGEGEMSNLVTSYRTKLFNYIRFNVTSDPWLPGANATGKDGPDVYNPLLYGWLQDYRASVLELRTTYSYFGQDCIVNSLWNFESAILFAITVVTTIGYGHVTPKTWEGQIVCICYATLGIPLFLMSVANVSSILGDLFRFLYSHVFCFLCNACMKDSDDGEDEEKSKQKAKPISNEPNEWEVSPDGKPAKRAAPIVVDSNETDDDDDGRVSVPLIIVVFMFAGYTGFGGFLFKTLEDWPIVNSCYFSFVSLSTMGFGDYVPGLAELSSGTNTATGGRNLMIAAVYIFFGMAILAMCFDLIQEGLVSKFTLIGEKVGIIKKEDEQEDEKIKEEIFDSGDKDKIDLQEKLKLQEQINNRTPSRIASSMMVPDGKGNMVMRSNMDPQFQQDYAAFKEPSTIFIQPYDQRGSNC